MYMGYVNRLINSNCDIQTQRDIIWELAQSGKFMKYIHKKELSVSDTTYLELIHLYKTAYNRTLDEGGKNYWTNLIKTDPNVTFMDAVHTVIYSHELSPIEKCSM